MLRLLAPLILLALIGSPSAAGAQEFDIPAVVISGGDLPTEVRLAPADADAFRRRIVQPPRLEEEPVHEGPSYRITSGYWPGAVRLEDEEEPEDVGDVAEYFPGGGYVRVDVAGEDVWLVLDLRQRAILDRYIRLSLESGDALGPDPSTMDVLALIAGREALGVAVAGRAIEEDTAMELLTGLAGANPDPFVEPRRPPQPSEGGLWLSVTLTEGRILRYFFDGGTLTEALGTESYDASSVAHILEASRPQALPVIEHEEPAGSLLWWPVALGGAAVAFAGAFWLRIRTRA